MRMIGSIPDDLDAERFSDYLVAQKIPNMVEQSAAGARWDVWVENDNDIDRAKSELETYLKSPADTRFDAQSQAKKIRAEQAAQQKRRRARYIDYRTQGSQIQQWAAPVTLTLIVLSIIITLVTGSILFDFYRGPRHSNPLGEPKFALLDRFHFVPIDSPQFKAWFGKYGNQRNDLGPLEELWWNTLKTGQVWRLITPIFPHLGIMHLMFNMFWLLDLGKAIEIRRGSVLMLLMVLVAGILSNVGQYFWTGPPSGSGMSGVVYALFGYIWIKQRFEPQLGLGVSEQTVWLMFAWLFLCMTGYLGHIGNAAHVVGLLVGVAIAIIPVLYRRSMRRLRT